MEDFEYEIEVKNPFLLYQAGRMKLYLGLEGRGDYREIAAHLDLAKMRAIDTQDDFFIKPVR